jgi:hypothetical protein
MKHHLPLPFTAACLSVVGLLLAAGGRVHAQESNNPLITLQETGSGTLLFPQSPGIPITGVLAPDPGPGGLGSALTFNLLGPPSLVAGDLFIFDAGLPLSLDLAPAVISVFSDVIRFNPAGTGSPGYPASVVFYSNPGEGQPADTGFPSSFYTNTFSLIESDLGDVTYTPTAGQPGFVAGFGVTYHIISAPAAVPDTGRSALLLGIGIAALVIIQRALTAGGKKGV